MSQIDITKMSSKGQVVIPLELRKGIKEGDKLVVIRNENQLILKKADEFDKNIEEDLEFARRTEEAWKDIDEGKYEEYTFDEFIDKLKKWK
jgi:AbrB family looped-hinge helix DNA binding protein